MKEVLIFDFDGTLADSTNCAIYATRKAFSEVGLRVPTATEIVSFMGIPIEVSFHNMIHVSVTDSDFQKLIKLFRKFYEELETEMIIAFPGIQTALKKLKAKNKRMFVMSSKQSKVLLRNLKFLKLSEYFEGFIGSDQVAFYKPHPAGVLRLIEKYELDAKNIQIIGDSKYDIQMAHAAEVSSCAVTWGTSSKEELMKSKPTLIINNPMDLCDL